MKRIIKASKSAKQINAKRKVFANAIGDFDSYDFERLMKKIADDIVAEYSPGTGDIDDFIREQLDYEIESECTYYADCINIIWGSHTTKWDDADYQISSLVALAGWIIEREFYQEGYYDDVYERLTGDDEDEE